MNTATKITPEISRANVTKGTFLLMYKSSWNQRFRTVGTFRTTDRRYWQKMGYSAIYYIVSIYYPILAAVGIPVNLAAIVILSRRNCGLSKCITRYLMAMAAADLMVVVFGVVLDKINALYLYADFLVKPPLCGVGPILTIAAMDCSVWLTVAFTFDRYVAICLQKLRTRYCTERTATVVIVAVVIGSCVQTFPFYFAAQPGTCIPKPEYYTSSLWRGYELFDTIMNPLLPLGLILLFNVLTTRYIIAVNMLRRGLRRNTDSQSDPEVKNRRKSMVLLFALSANFVLLWITNIVQSMTWAAVNVFFTDKYYNTPTFILQESGYMLMLLSSCTNTCIYGLSQRKLREELKNGATYLFTLNGKLCK
ncbi:probable G-protein coupled receptor 139 [Mobula hypostoma]|uniref:probable G-protein coupled receptor 139 n=1 Tax=Mobula hypostoma TaxID=723540 RepID=UPI002FC2B302